MRQFKFRAWLKNNHKMVYLDEFYAIADNGQGNWHFASKWIEPDIYIHNDEYILMQFTGLKDKNGEEIYEGDIVKLINEPKIWKLPENEICEVKWLKYSYYPFEFVNQEDVHIIGNIYENQEFLEKVIAIK